MRPLIMAIGFSPTTVAVSGIESAASFARSTTGAGGGGVGSGGSSTFGGGGGGGGGRYTTADANGSRATLPGQSITFGAGATATRGPLPLLPVDAPDDVLDAAASGAATAASGPDENVRITTAARITARPPIIASLRRSCVG